MTTDSFIVPRANGPPRQARVREERPHGRPECLDHAGSSVPRTARYARPPVATAAT